MNTKEVAEWLREAAEWYSRRARGIEDVKLRGHYERKAEQFVHRASQVEDMGPTSAQWKAALDPVMPADFKDWHNNSINDLPEVAAWVIRNLRVQLEEAEAQVEAMRCGNCRWLEADDLDRKDFCMSPKIQNEIYGEGPDFGCIYFEMREGR